MIKCISLSNFLSFGPEPVVIDLQPMNVVIGSSSSGKSNLLSAIDVLRSATSLYEFPAKICGSGDAADLLYKGHNTLQPAELCFILENKDEISKHDFPEIEYEISFTSDNYNFKLLEEKINGLDKNGIEYPFYIRNNETSFVREKNGELLELVDGKPTSRQSILSLKRDVYHYPAIATLSREVEKFNIYTNWSFGLNSSVHSATRTDMPGDYVDENFTNLPLVLNRLDFFGIKSIILEKIKYFYNKITDINVSIDRGTAKIFIKENDLFHPIQSSRISDGLLRYLCLLCIIYNKNPSPVICMDEPEVGMHFGMMPKICTCLKECSSKFQLIITTHSIELVDTLTSTPEDVLVAEKGISGSTIERLSEESMLYYKTRSLGDMWIKGMIGGCAW
jgi:predicted ATPase